ncbi:MAG TPA: hypothetical protein VH108_09175 [Gaiellaceae bacterium]|jgi:hypothetical protein|nr:hypothetical protein [Gaiellaceae bacterium]
MDEADNERAMVARLQQTRSVLEDELTELGRQRTELREAIEREAAEHNMELVDDEEGSDAVAPPAA